jgi:predicted GTPase
MPIKTIIMGAAGRDFHNFNTYYRGNKDYEVVAFTATQIPNIEGRVYPKELAGDLYPRAFPSVPRKNCSTSSRNTARNRWSFRTATCRMNM